MSLITLRDIARLSALFFLVFLFDGCRHLGSPEVTPESSNYPRNDSGMLRRVLVHGSVAPALSIAMSAIYEGKIASDCWTSPAFSGGEFEGTARPLMVTVPLSVTRVGDTFSAELQVDKFLPGHCGWHFAAVQVQISKAQLSFGPAYIIQAADPGNGESRSFNSSDDPVILRCRNLGSGLGLGYSCVPPFTNKSSHRLVDTTTVVNVEITDDDQK